MIGGFLRDVGGNFAASITVGLIPLMGGVALAIDYTELTRQKQATLNALDAAGIATARQIVSGAGDEALRSYARGRLRVPAQMKVQTWRTAFITGPGSV